MLKSTDNTELKCLWRPELLLGICSQILSPSKLRSLLTHCLSSPRGHKFLNCINHSHSLFKHFKIRIWPFQNNTLNTERMAHIFTNTSSHRPGQRRPFLQSPLAIPEPGGCRVRVPKLGSRRGHLSAKALQMLKRLEGRTCIFLKGSKSHHSVPVLHLSL